MKRKADDDEDEQEKDRNYQSVVEFTMQNSKLQGKRVAW